MLLGSGSRYPWIATLVRPCAAAQRPEGGTFFGTLEPAHRGVAQPGSALALGARGRGFESRRPDMDDHARRVPALSVSSRRWLAVSGARLPLAVSVPGAAGRRRAAPALLPDLIVRPIGEMRIAQGRGVKLLRFATLVGNRGPGLVELFPDPGAGERLRRRRRPLNDRVASQRIFGDTDRRRSLHAGDDDLA